MTAALLIGVVATVVGVALYLREKNAMTQKTSKSSPPASIGASRPLYSSARLSSQQISLADLIVTESQRRDISPQFMLALAVTESSLRAGAIGDDGLSYGLFQLNKKYISASEQELLDPLFNTQAAIEKMGLLYRSFPGNTYGDYAEAWTLGGAGRFRKKRRNPTKLTNMQTAIDELALDLFLTETP